MKNFYIILFFSLFCRASFAEPLPATSALQTQLDYQPKFNIRINPQGLLYTVLGIALDWGISDHWALGPSLNLFNGYSARNHLEVDQFGLSVVYHFGGTNFTNAWYIRTGANYLTVDYDRTQNQNSFDGTYHACSFRASVGRNWQIYKHLNAGAGFGLSSVIGPDSIVIYATNSEFITRPAPVSKHVRPFLEMHLAWAF